jgi:hypothetical protein
MDAAWASVLIGGWLLGHPSFEVRERASNWLVQAPAPTAQVLAAGSCDLEVSRRADQVARMQQSLINLLSAEPLPAPLEYD